MSRLEGKLVIKSSSWIRQVDVAAYIDRNDLIFIGDCLASINARKTTGDAA